ncbi:hypothetical protein FAIPA1_20352 [Frankia sp. AiPs1]
MTGRPAGATHRNPLTATHSPQPGPRAGDRSRVRNTAGGPLATLGDPPPDDPDTPGAEYRTVTRNRWHQKFFGSRIRDRLTDTSVRLRGVAIS